MEYVINAKNKKLGRLASEIAVILQGKKDVAYEPRLEGKDSVVVENVGEISFTGSKYEQKKYYRHTGYMGHLYEKTLRMAFEKDPKKVLRMAVERMLPKNALKRKRLRRLNIK